MPRSRTDSKRRPKGKRGWRQIQFDFDKDEDDSAQPQRDVSSFFHIDKKPRRLSREQQKKAAREALLAKGFSVHTLDQMEEITAKKNRDLQQRMRRKKLIVNGEDVRQHKRPKNLPVKKPRRFFKAEQAPKCIWDSSNTTSKTFVGGVKSHLRDNIGRHSSRAIDNEAVPSAMGITLPHPGQSVNPDPRERAHLQSLRARTMMKVQEKDAKDMRWTAERVLTLKEARTKRERADSLRTSVRHLKKILKKYPIYRLRTVKGLSPRRSLVRSKKLYGKQSKFSMPLPRGLKWRYVNRGKKMRDCSMRHWSRQLHNPVSMMYSDLQKQQRVRGVRFDLPTKRNRPWFGPRFKTSVRIGKLHHRNVNTRLYKGIDD